ncbi:trypco2 family protein [Streptomyces sp. MB22_4]|uniref:trypco2 family protein n=1 Tax=Streptomyces sp. MB22_4 TaxID=3383120 RepID=UPI0039A34D67
MNDITVGEAIDHLRAELTAARERAANSGVRFELGDILLEFTVELRRERSGKGSIKAWVVSGELGAAGSETAAHKLAFTLNRGPGRRGHPHRQQRGSDGRSGRRGRAGPVTRRGRAAVSRRAYEAERGHSWNSVGLSRSCCRARSRDTAATGPAISWAGDWY